MAIKVRHDPDPALTLGYAKKAGEAKGALEGLVQARELAQRQQQIDASIIQNQQAMEQRAAEAAATRRQRNFELQAEQDQMGQRFAFEQGQQDRRLATEAEMYRARDQRALEAAQAAQEAAAQKQQEHDYRSMIEQGVSSGKLYYTPETAAAIQATADDYSKMMADPRIRPEEKETRGKMLRDKRDQLIYHGAIPRPPQQKPPGIIEAAFPEMQPEQIQESGWEINGNFAVNKQLGVYQNFDPSTGKIDVGSLPKPDKPEKPPETLVDKYFKDELFRNREMNRAKRDLENEALRAADNGDGDVKPVKYEDIKRRALENIGAIDATNSPALPAPAAVPSPAPAQVAGQGIAQPKSKAEFDALPSGAVFIAPDGSTRRKP